jgi:hypothetical protein
MPQLPSLVALIASALATATHAAEIVNCWGGKSSIGSAQTECTIIKMTKNRKVFTITDPCTDLRGGRQIAGGPTVLTIDSPTRFTRDNEACR